MATGEQSQVCEKEALVVAGSGPASGHTLLSRSLCPPSPTCTWASLSDGDQSWTWEWVSIF